MSPNQPTTPISPAGREPLLKTKLLIPSLRTPRVARPDLVEGIHAAAGKTLILLLAPAAFGITSLLAGWVAQTQWPAAWLSLDAAANDPHRFLRYLIAALDAVLVGPDRTVCEASQAMLQSIQPLPLRNTRVAFVNDLTEIPAPFALVLDDFQFISSPAVNEALAFILRRHNANRHRRVGQEADPPTDQLCPVLHRCDSTGRGQGGADHRRPIVTLSRPRQRRSNAAPPKIDLPPHLRYNVRCILRTLRGKPHKRPLPSARLVPASDAPEPVRIARRIDNPSEGMTGAP
jgi:hypothetical protein